MHLRKRNWLHETRAQEWERRLKACEENLKDARETLDKLYEDFHRNDTMPEAETDA